MRIINRIIVDNFKRKHPQSRNPLRGWEHIVSNTNYQDLNDLRKSFGKKIDYLASGYTIFDIGGNKYRLITVINYPHKFIEIKIIWTHNEYSNPKNITDLKGGKI